MRHASISHSSKLATTLALLTTALVVGCDRGAGGSSNGPATPGVPELTFANIVHDFGNIVDVQTYDASFKFTNTGTGTLVISDIKAACGCTVPTLLKREFAPGETDEIRVNFDPKGKKGSTNKFITVISNAEPETTKLELLSVIKPLLDTESMHNLGNIRLGEGLRDRVVVRYDDPDLEITAHGTNNGAIKTRLLESGVLDSQPGQPPRYRAAIELTVHEKAPWGVLFANRLTVTVRGKPTPESQPIPRTYTIPLLGKVFNEIESDPAVAALGNLQPNQEYQKAVVVRRTSGDPLDILDARILESSMDGVQVRTEPITGSTHRVIVFGNVGEHRGWIQGYVTLETNVTEEGPLFIPFSGLVKN
jgi:hypothetical protein